MTDAAGEKNKDWKAKVAFYAKSAMGDHLPLPGVIRVKMRFYLPRPKSHYNSKKELKKNAPTWCDKRPDILKLARSTEDALTGIVYQDDSQTCSLYLEKLYSENPGVAILIQTLL